MRARFEALAAKWEAEAEARSHTADMQAVARAGVYSYCAATIRALLAEPERVRMEPQPPEDTDPKMGFAHWGTRYCFTAGGKCVYINAPTPAHRPVLVDGVWWWEVQP